MAVEKASQSAFKSSLGTIAIQPAVLNLIIRVSQRLRTRSLMCRMGKFIFMHMHNLDNKRNKKRGKRDG